MSFLETMAQESESRLQRAVSREPLEELMARALDRPAPPEYHPDGFEIWAELKPRSPSEGILGSGGDGSLADRALAYVRGGASVLSVLTEPSVFGGSLDLLSQIVNVTEHPVLRKDFLVHPYQVWQARAQGAAGVLLIGGMLPDGVLESMVDAAADAGLFVLLEAFDQAELDRATRFASSTHPYVNLGVNCRDLATLRVDLSRLADFRLPACRVMAESGVRSADDAASAAALGYQGILTGSALMNSPHPEDLVHELLASGRSACLPA